MNHPTPSSFLTTIMAKPACWRSPSCLMKDAIAGSIRHRESHQFADSNEYPDH
jgi:hypothetical protein